ncbi:hypothetical protein PVK06_038772 [Gossypium arboreum]|uniref:RNase H type-1 domain-containing protein n=1 Tax=Gossypium arboreum TaxID=29729 RepID=A0ABR0N121_GOSAR|nr:hypothetical protein PVK06_038772 [Gossypium arboreum]
MEKIVVFGLVLVPTLSPYATTLPVFLAVGNSSSMMVLAIIVLLFKIVPWLRKLGGLLFPQKSFSAEAKSTVTSSGIRHHLADNWVHLLSDGAVAKDLGNALAGDSGITVLRRIKRLLRSKGQWEIKYVTRECNLISDQLAKISLS